VVFDALSGYCLIAKTLPIYPIFASETGPLMQFSFKHVGVVCCVGCVILVAYWNLKSWREQRKLCFPPAKWFQAFYIFCKFCFDLYPPLIKDPRDHPRPSSWDRQRLLHLSWHSVVFVPVIVVTLVGKVLGASLEDVVFFASVALATVALETCVGVILTKASEIEDLTRQTKRIMKLADVNEMREWLAYFVLRHKAAKTGLVKAALVTIVSVVMFSTIVGVEVIRMINHSPSVDHKIDKFAAAMKKLSTDVTDNELSEEQKTQIGEIVKTAESSDDLVLFLALTLCLLMICIAMAKVWTQSRSSLYEHDAMDLFATGSEASKAFEKDVHFHLSGHDDP